MSKIISIILKRKKYLLISVLVAIVTFSILYYLTVLSISNNSILVYAVMNGVVFTVLSLLLSAITVTLLGIHVAVMVFRHDLVKTVSLPDKAAGFGGGTIGLVAAGCPTCGAPVLGLLGYPLGLFLLPFGGLELKVLSIGLLLLAIYLVVKNINRSLACQID